MNVPIQAWMLIKDTVQSFINDNALSRGASIAYYTLFAIAPVLLIIVAIAGLALGHDAAQGAIVGQLSGLMGDATAKAIEEMIKSAADRSAGTCFYHRGGCTHCCGNRCVRRSPASMNPSGRQSRVPRP